ncbi:MAG: flagellar protein FliT [Ramlibacter sp.]|nr:flagellar protein FliT [Ramlibacter sp.]
MNDDFDRDALLRYYSALESASYGMLAAARKGDWDQLCRLEGACAVVVARLRTLPLARAVEESNRDERMRMLQVILANDAEIRRICEPSSDFMTEHVFGDSKEPQVAMRLH